MAAGMRIPIPMPIREESGLMCDSSMQLHIMRSNAMELLVVQSNTFATASTRIWLYANNALIKYRVENLFISDEKKHRRLGLIKRQR